MTGSKTKDWNPGAYSRFRGLRLQPAMDLLNAIDALPEGPVVDLGCGAGVMGEALKARFPGRALIGVDNSPAMLGRASETGWFDDLIEADIAKWVPAQPPALVFSNAALQWLPDHADLLRRLSTEILLPGGRLAVQMPHQNDAPSHKAWREAFAELFPGRDVARGPKVHPPQWYHRTLAANGTIRVWETDYYQALPPDEEGHPVRRFTESTYGKPFLDACAEDERQDLIRAYEARVAQAYPCKPSEPVLFPFKRLFFIYGT